MFKIKSAVLLAAVLALTQVGCDTAVEGDTAPLPHALEAPGAAASTGVPTPQGPDPLSCGGRYYIYWRDADGFLEQYGLTVSGDAIATGSGGTEYVPGRFYKYVDVATTGSDTATVCTVVTGFSGGSSSCITVDVTGPPCA